MKRMLTEERVPAGSGLARFVDTDEAERRPVLRDLFADQHEDSVQLENPKLLADLTLKKFTAAADELAPRWKWAEAGWRKSSLR